MTRQTTYRDDEIVTIYANCNTIEQLDTASASLGYLTIIGAQTYRPVISKLYMLRASEIKRKTA
ncbi:hypothetical protein JJL45_05330 [Tamlana sp. s12]|uniref:hypothetical protein n=1 Tax=Tamlana sp. s12 TaxID=1630406 RepID=UPI0007FBBAED|nr:hypothetical protein [Tamlana sp. s12]OBQ56073.1 hypothetical protein VQ01_06730 [Tamlana sp. s12]QQY83414.1 hypothetical protein JJL45_05330 [Tamlana sp. s12]